MPVMVLAPVQVETVEACLIQFCTLIKITREWNNLFS